jgi:ankyrin repeat protein
MGRTPLSWAAEKGHEAVVKLLLAKDGVDSDSKDCEGRTPLSIAARRGHSAVVELLLARNGVDPNSKVSTADNSCDLWQRPLKLRGYSPEQGAFPGNDRLKCRGQAQVLWCLPG